MVNNTSYGTDALKNNLGINNSAFGAYASYNNTDSSNNTSVGSNSAFFNTTGSNNTSLGAGSLCNNTTGSLNTAVGSSALEGIVGQSVGNQNTAVGVQALYSNSGIQNTAIGAYAALGVTGGNYNTFLGTNTTFDNLSQTYQYSTAIGYGAEIYSNNQIIMGGNSSGQYPDVIIRGKGFLPNFDAGTAKSDQIVPKSYVDNASQGFSLLAPCLCIDTSGVITDPSSIDVTQSYTSTLTIDGQTLSGGDRVLFNNQGDLPGGTAVNNGIYDVSYSAPTYSFVRSSDMANGSDAANATCFVKKGTLYSNSIWRQVDPSGTVGTHPLYFNLYNQISYKLGVGLNSTTASSETYLNVDNSLNFVNFLDSDSTASVPPGLTGGNGNLAIGTNTTNSIVIGPTGGIPIQAQSVIQAQKGITGATGSFSYLITSQDAIINNNITLGRGGGNVDGNIAIGVSSLLNNNTSVATQNVAIGYQALKSNTLGYSNAAIGYKALQANTTGANNVAIGSQALQSNTTGANNVALGGSALQNNTTGFQNFALGLNCLYSNLSGQDNVGIGVSTLYNNTTGSYNVGIGFGSLKFNTTQSYNVAIGWNSMTNVNIGNSNTAIGYQSMSAGNGNNRIAVGYNAGYNNQGTNAIAIGYQAGYTNQGTNAIAIGYNAGYTNQAQNSIVIDATSSNLSADVSGIYIAPIRGITQDISSGILIYNTSRKEITYSNSSQLSVPGGITGATGSFSYLKTSQDAIINNNITLGRGGGNIDGNIALGVNALLNSANSGIQCVAIGYQALQQNTGGQQNVAIGYNTLQSNTTGYSNVALGYQTLQANTTGIYNMGIGANSLQANTTGTDNIGIGNGSLYSLSSGNGNIAIGSHSAESATLPQSYAIAIGLNAGNKGQGTNSIMIGGVASASSIQPQPANNIIINATGSTVTGANTNATYIAPLRISSTTSAVYYDSTTNELTYASSSRKYKNTIEDLNVDTSVLYNLKPKTFLLNNDPNAGQQIGYIAEEVKEVHHKFAAYNSGNLEEPVAINFNTILVFLVEEVKKLKQENLDLKNEISQIKEKLN